MFHVIPLIVIFNRFQMKIILHQTHFIQCRSKNESNDLNILPVYTEYDLRNCSNSSNDFISMSVFNEIEVFHIIHIQ